VDTISDVDSEDGTVARPPHPRLRVKKPRLRIINEAGQPIEEDSDSDDEDDGVDDNEGLAPDEPADGELSPVDGLKEFNWDIVDEEYKEFMADVTDDGDEDDDYGDEEGDGDRDGSREDVGDGDGDATSPTGTKRKHVTDDEGGDAESDASRGRTRRNESALAKKLRVSRGRPSSGLRAVATPDEGGVETGSLPTPQITGDEDEVALLPTGEGNDPVKEVEIDEDDLLAELEAEEGAEMS
jgi:RNA polymerase II subunit A-like phosphatase